MFFRKSLAVGIVLLAGICGFAQNSSSHSSVLNVEWLDRTVDPCVDLFTFSCGKWIQSNPIPPDQSSWGIYNKLQDDNLKQLRELLEATSAPNRARSSNAQKIGDYYASCMDETAIDALRYKAVAARATSDRAAPSEKRSGYGRGQHDWRRHSFSDRFRAGFERFVGCDCCG